LLEAFLCPPLPKPLAPKNAPAKLCYLPCPGTFFLFGMTVSYRPWNKLSFRRRALIAPSVDSNSI